MDGKPDRVKEVVWTGRSDRRVRDKAETHEPRKIARTRIVYKVVRDGEKIAVKQAKPPYTDKPTPAPAKRPTQAKPESEPVRAEAAPQPPATQPAAPAAPAVSPSPAQPSPRQQSHAIAQTVVGSFVDRMKQEARRKGGVLSLGDIEVLGREFEHKTAALEALLEKTFQDYARRLPRGRREARRHPPFDRLLVSLIEHLFPGRNRLTPAKGGLSRRILPGFFMAAGIMMGAEVNEECRGKAQVIFDRIGDKAGEPDWESFAADPEARILLTDALVAMAAHFANPDKRAAWVIDMINNHLSPPDTEPDTPADWRLGRPAYERMIDALFSDLMAAVNNAKAREGLTLRYGPETCASLVTIMKGLGA